VTFKSYPEQYLDSTGMFREAIISILATVAKQEHIRLSERVQAGLARARTKGRSRPLLLNVHARTETEP
jgi:DNA invertase Pin-like site-specific DNA recombinase